MYTEFQSKPIESTPVLKGEDLINLIQSLYKTDTHGNLRNRKSALALLTQIKKIIF